MVRGESVLIAGAGAVGSVIGGMLRRAGWPVTLLGRAVQLQAIERRGLRISGLWGEHVVSGFHLASRRSELAGPYAAVLLTVKSYDSASVVRLVAPHLGPRGVVISLQNGLGNVEEAAAAAGAERVLGGRVIFGAILKNPGHVQVTVYAEPVMLGSPEPRRHPALDAAARRWARIFDEAGIPCEETEEIIGYLWAKVFYNAPLNPLGAILRLTYGELAEEAGLRALMDGIIEEAYAVAAARRVPLRWGSAAAFREAFYGRLVPATAGHRSSMLQDIERGRPTEVDAINGRIWEYGCAADVPTPLNAALTRLVRATARQLGSPREPESHAAFSTGHG